MQNTAIGKCLREHGLGLFAKIVAASVTCFTDSSNRVGLCIFALINVADSLGKYIKCVKDNSTPESLAHSPFSDLEEIHKRLQTYINEHKN